MKIEELGLPPYKDRELIVLRVVEEACGEIRAGEAVSRVVECLKRDYRITDEQIKQLKTETMEGIEVLHNHINWIRLRLVERGELDSKAPRGLWRITDKGRERLKQAGIEVKPCIVPDEIGKLVQTIKDMVERLGQLAKEAKPTPLLPSPDEIIQKIKEMGELLGNKVEVKWGPVYEHDCCWRPTPYANPELVWEVCYKGVPEKDIVSLDWAVKNWKAKGILVLFDEADFEKAKKVIPTGRQIHPLKVENVVSLYSLIKAGNIDVLKTILGI